MEIASSSLSTTRESGEVHVLVAIDGHVAGGDRDGRQDAHDAQRIVERLRAEGVRHIAMISGDRRLVAKRVGRALGVDRAYAEQFPEDKLEVARCSSSRN